VIAGQEKIGQAGVFASSENFVRRTTTRKRNEEERKSVRLSADSRFVRDGRGGTGLTRARSSVRIIALRRWLWKSPQRNID